MCNSAEGSQGRASLEQGVPEKNWIKQIEENMTSIVASLALARIAYFIVRAVVFRR